MRTFTDILGEFLETMDTSVVVSSVEEISPSYYRLYMGASHYGKTTLHAVKGRTITDPADSDYLIHDFSHDEYIDVMAVSKPPTGKWTLPRLAYLPGTPKAVNAELSKTFQSPMPIIWLMEIMQERVSYDAKSDYMIMPIARLFFLDDADFRNWDNITHLEESVRPMRNYADRMIRAMMFSDKFGDPIGEPVFINQARFGLSFNQPKTQDNFSHQTNLFGERVSGVELRLEIPVRRKCYE